MKMVWQGNPVVELVTNAGGRPSRVSVRLPFEVAGEGAPSAAVAPDDAHGRRTAGRHLLDAIASAVQVAAEDCGRPMSKWSVGKGWMWVGNEWAWVGYYRDGRSHQRHLFCDFDLPDDARHGVNLDHYVGRCANRGRMVLEALRERLDDREIVVAPPYSGLA